LERPRRATGGIEVDAAPRERQADATEKSNISERPSMANTLVRCLIPLTLIVVAGCSRGPVPNVAVVEVTPSTRSYAPAVVVSDAPAEFGDPAGR
jgi:hypothetical protein